MSRAPTFTNFTSSSDAASNTSQPPPATKESITKTRKVMALDTETLGIANTSAVFQIGLAWFNVTEHYTSLAQVCPEYSIGGYESTSFWLDIDEQVKLGASIDMGTIAFHAGHAVAAGLDLKLILGTAVAKKAVEVLQSVQNLTKDAIEVWINHPSFDVPKLDFLTRNLCGEGLDKLPLWHYRAEMDVHTHRKSTMDVPNYPLSIPMPHKEINPGSRPYPLEKAGKHDAQIDALWNIRVAHHSVLSRIQRSHMTSVPIWIDYAQTNSSV